MLLGIGMVSLMIALFFTGHHGWSLLLGVLSFVYGRLIAPTIRKHDEARS